MAIPEVDWPILPDGHRWRVGRELITLDFGSYYSDEYYIYIEKKNTYTVWRPFKKVTKTKWVARIQNVIHETGSTPATILSRENVEYAAYDALNDLENLFAKIDAEEKFMGTHP